VFLPPTRTLISGDKSIGGLILVVFS
jgi:hypothetical protein